MQQGVGEAVRRPLEDSGPWDLTHAGFRKGFSRTRVTQ